ncbi:hypothetical protein [Nitrosomonas aestuarii]|uniref:hypothetical protein n=1 Tax=Nitrosomonas aestuarii TaxID=52441 RepID=UPI001113E3B7|nr:hypothetical protein [Nitrosomonas aestuarii]
MTYWWPGADNLAKSGELIPLSGVVFVARPTIDLNNGRKKTTTLGRGVPLCLGVISTCAR